MLRTAQKIRTYWYFHIFHYLYLYAQNRSKNQDLLVFSYISLFIFICLEPLKQSGLIGIFIYFTDYIYQIG